jgi:surfactin family lipopeptide synthetase A
MSQRHFDQGAVGVAPASVRTNGRKSLSISEVLELNVCYWREKLAGIPAILELPTDRHRPPVQTFRARRETVQFPEHLKEALETLSEQAGVSLFEILLAALQTLLTRYMRQDDIVVGVVTQDDKETETHGWNQAFDASLVIRTDTSGDLTFRQLLSRVNDEVNSARQHQKVPWDRVIKAVQPEQDSSRHPLFQVLFSMDGSQNCANADAASAESGNAMLKVDLEIRMVDQSNGLAAQFTYSTDLFDSATIVRMKGHLRKLLEGIVKNPDENVWRIPLLTDTERHLLVVEWNRTGMDYARHVCVHQLFEAQAARTPNATALVFGKETLTYAELDRRANQLAKHLVSLGAKPDSLVGICLERSLEMVVGLLGILKAGAAYVPLDPAYPRDRIAFMLENSEAPLLLTQSQLTENLPSTASKVVLIDNDWKQISKQSDESPALSLSPESRAYVIYTSGSTGKPKGVEIPHRAVVNFLTTMAERPGMNTNDRLLAVTTLSFDIAGLEIYLPLTQGASVEIVSRQTASDGNQLLEKMKGSGSTVMQATPATWRMLLEAGWTGDPRLKILVGGEAVSQKLADQLLERSASVWNVYGPTETTIWSTLSKIEAGQSVTIGRPIGNTEIFILDKMLQPVPIGVAGELHIGGNGLARGYLKWPELTAAKFIVHPLNPDPKARLYKTGDLVRYLPNGNIEFLGRIDHQVKIRGFRIELGEIEAVLRQHSGINETVVLAREDTPGDKRVVAYFVPTRDAAPTTAELRSFLREKLPEYMLPSVFVILKNMPLTPNGKVDRRALPAPDHADLAPTATFVAPKDIIESQLVQIWEAVLGVRPIGIKDNYFELGGHSLLAVKLMNRIEEACGKTLPIATLLQAPTIEQLAVIVRRKGWSPSWSCLVPIQTGGSKPPFFCIHGINGAVVRFYDLARHLGADQPFYGLQAQGLDAGRPCDTRTEDMASHYIEEIRRVQPQGPYFLGGYSFGGAIAFEMAQQLVVQGQNAVVVLFDTNFPQHRSPGFLDVASILSALLTFFRLPAREKRAYLLRMVKAPIRPIQWKLHVARLPRIVKKVRKACLQAERGYTPRVYSGRVILFRSNHKPLGQVSDPRAGWNTCAARGLEICEIEANHENILLEPQVRLVAEQLKTRLDADAQRARRIPLPNTSPLEKTVQ